MSKDNVSKFPVKGQPKPICPRCHKPPEGVMICLKGDEGEVHLHESCWFKAQLDAERTRADAATRILASMLVHVGNAIVLDPADFKEAEKRGFKFTAEDRPENRLELRLEGSMIVPPSFGTKP